MKLMRRIARIEQHVEDLTMEVENCKEMFTSFQLEKEESKRERKVLPQQLKLVTVELAVTKVEAKQSEKEIAKMEASFAEQYSKVMEDV